MTHSAPAHAARAWRRAQGAHAVSLHPKNGSSSRTQRPPQSFAVVSQLTAEGVVGPAPPSAPAGGWGSVGVVVSTVGSFAVSALLWSALSAGLMPAIALQANAE